MKLTAKEKRAIIVKALDSCSIRTGYTKTISNPQIKEMYIKNKGYQEALEDVLLLLDGNAVSISCLID
jgi:hypothetical protein